MLLVYLSCAFVAGIFLGSVVVLPFPCVLVGLVPLVGIPFFPNAWRLLSRVSLCLLALIGGAFRYPSSLPVVDENHLAYYNECGAVTVTGLVVSSPEPVGQSVTLRVQALSVRLHGDRRDVSGDLLVRLRPASDDYGYGDVLSLTGRLETPKVLGDFDYPAYLARQGIYSVMSFPRVHVEERGQGWLPLQWLHTVRQGMAQSINRVMPEPHASIACAVLLGIRGGIPSDLNQAMSDTGTTHILAISGFNLTIILGIVLGAIVWLIGRYRYIYVWLTMAFMWVYVVLAGVQPPVVRAAIMGSIFLLAEFFGRQKSALNALTFAGAVMVGVQPQVLWQVGFQLSFLAMAGLVLLAPGWQAWGRDQVARAFGQEGFQARGFTFLSDSLLVAAAATVAVYPVIAYYFQTVSLVGLPATVLAAIALPGIIVTVSVTALLGMVAWWLSWLVGWVAWLFITYLTWVVHSFHALPLAAVKFGCGGWYVLGYYLTLVAVVLGFRYRHRLLALTVSGVASVKNAVSRFMTAYSGPAIRWTLVILFVVASLIWAAVLTLPDERLHVAVLDVGQGDAIFIRTPNHQKLLVDGGPALDGAVSHLGRLMPFWDRKIDLVVLTQPQADHLTGLLAVLERYQVDKVVESGLVQSSAIYHRWSQVLALNRVERSIVSAGQYIELGRGIRMDVLHPGEKLMSGTADDINSNAMVLRLSWGKVSFLLTSDITQQGEFELLAGRKPLSSTVLKVAHHGSRTSTSALFLEAVKPDVAVISVGAGNSFGHPHGEVLSRLRSAVGEDRLYMTSVNGTVHFTTDGYRLWVRTERHQKSPGSS